MIEIEDHTVDVHIGRLRRALSKGRERDPIRTVRSIGYAFDETSANVGHARERRPQCGLENLRGAAMLKTSAVAIDVDRRAASRDIRMWRIWSN
jgi:DNA-binding winged helix-turn-helix (wHTH) protein